MSSLEKYDLEEVELGEFVKRHRAKDQVVLEFEEYYHFLLENEKFHLASKYTNLNSEGVGLNLHVVELVDLDKLVIEDRKEDCFYIVDDLEYVKENYGRYKINGTSLVIIPIDGLEKVSVNDKDKIPYDLIFGG